MTFALAFAEAYCSVERFVKGCDSLAAAATPGVTLGHSRLRSTGNLVSQGLAVRSRVLGLACSVECSPIAEGSSLRVGVAVPSLGGSLGMLIPLARCLVLGSPSGRWS